MGVGGGKQKSSNNSTAQSNSKQYSRSLESALSREQLAILQQRQQQYNDIFFPELAKGIAASANLNSSKNISLQRNNVQQVNSAFNSAMDATNQNLAQRNLSNSAVSAGLTAQNERARASALADAYYNTLNSSETDKQNYLKLGMSMSPQATTSAQYHYQSSSVSDSKSTSKGKSSGWNANVNFG